MRGVIKAILCASTQDIDRLFGQLKPRVRAPLENARIISFQDTTHSIRSDLRQVRRIERGLVPKIHGLAVLYTELVEGDSQLEHDHTNHARHSSPTSESSTLTMASVVVVPTTVSTTVVYNIVDPAASISTNELAIW